MDVVGGLVVGESCEVVGAGEPWDEFLLMLKHPTKEVIGHAYIQSSSAVGQNVNVVLPCRAQDSSLRSE